MEQLGLKEDLAIRDRDDIGWDVSGHITSLSLDDGESGQRTRSVVLVHLGCAFEKTGMKIEDITWVGLTTGGSSEEEGHLTVSDGLLGQIVIDDEGVLRVVTEVLADSTTRVRGKELEGCGVGGCCSHDDRVLHAVSALEQTHDVRNGGPLLADGDVDAVKRLRVVACLEDGFLVDDGVDSNGGFACLSVTDDQLTLSSANWHLN